MEVLRKEMNIEIKYFSKEITPIKAIENGDLIDLRAAEDIYLRKGEYYQIPLGIGMKLPKGYEAHVYPRSSTYKNYHVIQANGVSIIDNSYSGDNDQWFYPIIALEDTHIPLDARICQFRIFRNMEKIVPITVTSLDDNDRGGFGSTGTK